MDEKKKVVFIANPISGTQNKKQVLQCVKDRIDQSKYDCEIILTEYAGHAAELATKAVDGGAFIVVAVGGDGTINEIARSIRHTSTALGIIPCGSGNGLARHLQIPLEIKGAIDVINEGVVECVDYGKINGLPFFCTCGVGFDAFVSSKFASSGRRGLLTYVENTLHESLKYKSEAYEIETGDGTLKYKAFLIACANASQYGNNAYIAPQASLSDGLMDVTVLEPFTVLDIPSLAYQLFNKTIDQNSRIKTFKCKNIRIHRAKEGVIHYDGDPVMAGKDIEVEIVPKGINMVVNQAKRTFQPASLIQLFSDYFDAVNALKGDFKNRNRQLFVLNRELLRKLTKK